MRKGGAGIAATPITRETLAEIGIREQTEIDGSTWLGIALNDRSTRESALRAWSSVREEPPTMFRLKAKVLLLR